MGEPSPARQTLFQRARAYFAIKGRRYWLTALLVLVSSIVLTPLVPDQINLTRTKYWLYQQLTQLSPRKAKARYIRLVYIEDAEYYHGILPAGRKPINRTYLARIVTALTADKVAAIALDFNLHTTDSTAQLQLGHFEPLKNYYQSETDDLVRAVELAAAQSVKIVLPKNAHFDDEGGARSIPDIYQPYGLCWKLIADGVWSNPGTAGFTLDDTAKSNISCGYIQVPLDMRRVPPIQDVGDAGRMDSFSLAIARAIRPEDANDAADHEVFASFIPQDRMVRGRDVFTASQVLNPEDAKTRAMLANRIVIVGGHWETPEINSGQYIDTFDAPGGLTSGALIHANFTEAVLDSRLSWPIPSWIFEVTFAVAAAFVFAAYSHLWVKIAILGGAVVCLLLMQWLVFSLFGIFFEAFLPVLGLGVHSIIERLAEPRHPETHRPCRDQYPRQPGLSR